MDGRTDEHHDDSATIRSMNASRAETLKGVFMKKDVKTLNKNVWKLFSPIKNYQWNTVVRGSGSIKFAYALLSYLLNLSVFV